MTYNFVIPHKTQSVADAGPNNIEIHMGLGPASADVVLVRDDRV